MTHAARFASSFRIFYAVKMLAEKSFTLPSFAKINLSLRILGKRDDGFHELCTVFQTISLKDELTFRASGEIILICGDENIPSGENNLIVRAARTLQEKFAIEKGAEIRLEKNIPAPGGLGGGSSNAAVALIGLARLWNLKVGLDELEAIGKSLGADVPFFFVGGTALGVGRGDEISPLEDLTEKKLLVATPAVSVSTKDAFARLYAARLTNERSKSILEICRNQAKNVDFTQANLTNDFEETVFGREPEIGRVKQTLLSFAGAKCASLSGSGASVFAVFETMDARRKAFDSLQEETSWRVFEAETISRADYRALLNIEG